VVEGLMHASKTAQSPANKTASDHAEGRCDKHHRPKEPVQRGDRSNNAEFERDIYAARLHCTIHDANSKYICKTQGIQILNQRQTFAYTLTAAKNVIILTA